MEKVVPKRRSKRQRELLQNELENQNIDQLTSANLRHMELASLKRYKRVFHVKTRHTRSENEELYTRVVRHFADSETPIEDMTIENFIYNVKNEKMFNT